MSRNEREHRLFQHSITPTLHHSGQPKVEDKGDDENENEVTEVTGEKNTAPRIRWIRRAAVPPRTIRKNLRRYTGSGFRPFQMICLSIVLIGLVALCKICYFFTNSS